MSSEMDYTVPFLRKGAGKTPKDGGCINQIVDWINRLGWSDDPPCEHPVLRDVALIANDSLDDAQRQALLDLAPRLAGTASDDEGLLIALASFCIGYAKDMGLETISDPIALHAAALAADAVADADAGDSFDLLVALLDEYDRITGRTEVKSIDWKPVCEVMYA